MLNLDAKSASISKWIIECTCEKDDVKEYEMDDANKSVRLYL